MSQNEINDVIKKIIKRRKELNYSYQDLADKTGLNKSTLMRYEKGIIKSLTLDKIQLIAKALNVSPAYLFGWEDTKDINIPQEYLDKYKVTKRDLNQREDVLNHAQAFMMDDKVDPNDKQKLFEIVNKLYWESKAINKEKYSKKKNNK